MTLTAPSPATAAARRPSPGRTRRQWRHRLTVLSFLAPALVGIAVFFVYPLLAAIYFSFTRFDLLTTPQWVGLRNYVYLFAQDPLVWQAGANTLWLVVVLVPARMLAALVTAMLLARLRSGSSVFRTIFYLPALAPPVAATIAFVFLFNPATGPVNGCSDCSASTVHCGSTRRRGRSRRWSCLACGRSATSW